MDKSITITLIIAISVVLVAGMGYLAIDSLTPETSSDTVNVEGIASVNVMPDIVGVYFYIQTNGSTSSEARDANSKIVETMKSAIIALGYDESKIQSQNFNIYPDYIWKDGERTDNGFLATHSIKIELDANENEKIGEVVDAGVDAGAMVSYINFELSQELQNRYKAESIKLAAEDARIKANAVAEGFDKKVGKLVSTQVNDFGYYPWRTYSMGVEESVADVKLAATEIVPSEQEITSRVSATFKLE